MSDAGQIDPRSDALRSATPVTLTMTAALLAAVIFGQRSGLRFEEPVTVLLLAVVGWVAETFASLVQRFSSMSLTSTLVGVAAVLCGPLGACVVGVAATALIAARLPRMVRYFNAAMTGWVALLGGLTFDLMTRSDRALTDAPTEVVPLALPMAVMTLVMMLVNALLISLVIKVTAAVPYGRSLRDFGASSAPLFLIGGLISYLIVVLWIGAGTGPVTILVMAPPLLLAQWAYSSMEAESSNVDHSVDVLAGALDLNRPGTRDHGELVMVIAEEVGNVAGLSDTEIATVRRSARLHHLGTMTAARRPMATIDAEACQLAADLLAPIHYLEATRRVVAAQADPIGTRPAGTAVLAVADALASTVENRMIASGVDIPDRTLIDACIAQVGTRNDLEPGARAALAAAPPATLAGRITMKLTGCTPRNIHGEMG